MKELTNVGRKRLLRVIIASCVVNRGSCKADAATQNLNLPSRNYNFNYNFTISPRLVYNATLGYSKFTRFFLDASDNTAGAQFFGYDVSPALAAGTFVNVRPVATFDIYRAVGTNGPQKQFTENFQINQPATWLVGAHTMKFGADLRRYYASGFIAGGSPNGNIGFNALQTSNGAATITRLNAAKLFPQYASVTAAVNNRDSIYHSLQAKMEKRLSGDLSFLLAYTFSKAIDNAQNANFNTSESSNTGNLQNPYDLRDARAVGTLDRTHLFAGSAVYALPFGKGKRWLHDG